MATTASGEWLIRPYTRSDRDAVRTIAAETAWSRGHHPDAIPDPWIWAEGTTRYFTDREPEHAWVIASRATSTLAGYLLGTANVLSWEKYLLRLAPGIALRTITSGALMRGGARRALWSLARSAFAGELVVPPKVQLDFPGTFRFALKDEARGRGLGARAIELYLTAMRARGVRGVHAQSLGIDGELSRFLQRAGFQLAASWPVSTWAHVEARPVDLLTWVLPL